MWEFQHTETTTAAPAELWRHYADVADWPQWDHDIESIALDGPFARGTTGSLKPAGGPKTKFRFVEVQEGVLFVDESFLPLTRMRFEHRIEPGPGGTTRFTHRVTFTGPLSPLFARVIGKKVAAGLPEAMRRLASLAEQTQQAQNL